MRYGEALGGLGTGIGEGNRSFECGRQGACVKAVMVEEEVDCDAEDARDMSDNESSTNRLERRISEQRLSTSPGTTDSILRPGSSGQTQLGPGYARHEIEGIGGVVKRKLVRMVRVGACVTKFEDESEQGKYLVREVEGRCRSWCGWCWKVIPGPKDKLAYEGL